VIEYRLISEPPVDLGVEAAFEWYENERPGLRLEFLAELRATYNRVADGPLKYQELRGGSDEGGSPSLGPINARPVPAVRQHRRCRHLLPVERMDQDGRFAAGRPGATDRRPLGDPAFILEGNPGVLACWRRAFL